MAKGQGQGQGHDLQGEWAIKELRQPGIEPGSAAWKATMLTITPLTLVAIICRMTIKFFHFSQMPPYKVVEDFNFQWKNTQNKHFFYSLLKPNTLH